MLYWTFTWGLTGWGSHWGVLCVSCVSLSPDSLTEAPFCGGVAHWLSADWNLFSVLSPGPATARPRPVQSSAVLTSPETADWTSPSTSPDITIYLSLPSHALSTTNNIEMTRTEVTIQCFQYNVSGTMSPMQCHQYNVTDAMSPVQCQQYDVTRTMSLVQYLQTDNWRGP